MRYGGRLNNNNMLPATTSLQRAVHGNMGGAKSRRHRQYGEQRYLWSVARVHVLVRRPLKS